MARKYDQSSGPSYSLLALLKRTLFLHETAVLDELAEEVHEYMLKDQPCEQIRQRYVEPILKSNPSFLEVKLGKNIWKLSEGNKVNDSVYDVFKKYQAPLSERQILNRLAKEEHLAKIEIVLDLKNDARFSDLEGGKYWILSEWMVVNDYARSILLKIRGGLSEKELLQRVVEEYQVEKDTVIFLPMLDDRFVKKEKKWTLKRFVEQKTKLRASRIERLYNHLKKAGVPLTSNELTTFVLNMPANATDVEEKLATDPRFVKVENKWDLRERVDKREAEIVMPEEEYIEEFLPTIQPEPSVAKEIEPEPGITEQIREAIQGEEREEQADVFEKQEEVPEEREEQELAEQVPPAIEPVVPEMDQEQEESEEEPFGAIEVPQEAVTEVPDESQQLVEPQQLTLEEDERLRQKVITFLQDAFHSEGIVYSADIIDDLAASEDKAELFEQFSLEHFANPSRNRELTDSDLIKFIVYLAEPTLNNKIIDPCCGTGGFLIQILNTLRANLQDANWTEKDLAIEYELQTGQFYFVQLTPEECQSLPSPLKDERVRQLPIERFCRQQLLTGIDVEKYAYNSTELNIAIHGYPDVVLHQEDALTSKQIGSGLYDLVIGNPPSSSDYPTRFLRRSLSLAKPGGKILLLLPEKMFSDFRLISSSLRNQIAAQTIVKAVIEFPEPYNERAYGSRRILFFCVKKQLEAEQQSHVFVGRIPDFDGLRDIIEVLEEPDVPVSQSDEPIPVDLVMFILLSYHGSGYNLLLEGLRRQVLEGFLMTMEEWNHTPQMLVDADEED